MGKNKFLEPFKLAAQPLPKGAGKQTRGDDYSGRQILKRINQDNKARLRGKSRPKNTSTGRKSPRYGSVAILFFAQVV